MLIPSIDLKNGAVVQLVQGERASPSRDADVFPVGSGASPSFPKSARSSILDAAMKPR